MANLSGHFLAKYAKNLVKVILRQKFETGWHLVS